MEPHTNKTPKSAIPTRRRRVLLAVAGAFVVLVIAIVAVLAMTSQPQGTATSPAPTTPKPKSPPSKPGNPISDVVMYTDKTRRVNAVVTEYERSGKKQEAGLLATVAQQPSALWLTGPTDSDKAAARDIATVERTSGEAATQGTMPVYQLYAIPKRDACAAYSRGGFATSADYLAWIDKVIAALRTKAIISVEADAIAHTIQSKCLTPQQKADRYGLIKEAARRLSLSPNVAAIYLDAAHPNWFPDPQVLVEPLRKSGIEYARGVAVNVSFFAETRTVTAWSQQLIDLLGGDKGIVIDTSRNGKGVSQATGDAQWCNPPGRGIGLRPTTVVSDKYIDAYIWIKTIGESDGACFGNPPAGTFVPAIALELARNAQN